MNTNSSIDPDSGSNLIWEAISLGSPEGFVVLDSSGCVVFETNRVSEILGGADPSRSQGEVSGWLKRDSGWLKRESGRGAEPGDLWSTIFSGDSLDQLYDLESVRECPPATRSSEEPSERLLARRVDGLWEPIRGRARLVKIQNSIFSILTLREPVDERELQRELDEERARSHAVFQTAVDAIVTIDARGIIRSANPATEALFGYSAEELIKHNVSKLMPAPHRLRHDQYLENYLSTGTRRIIGIGREVEGRHKDGTRFPVDLAVSEFNVRGERYFTGLVRDLRDRKRAEESLRDSAERLQLMSDSLPILIAYLDQSLHYRFANRAFRIGVLGDAEADPAHSLTYLPDTFSEADFSNLELAIEKGSAGQEFSFETRLKLRGSRQGFYQVDCIPHRKRDEDPSGFYLLIRDVTDNKQAEAQRRQQEKLAAVGQLASGLAHEIGNPLSSISAVAQTVERKTADTDLKAKLGLIGHHIQRVNRIVRQLVDFARPAQVDWKRCCLNKLVKDTIAIAQHDRRAKHIKITFDLDASLPPTFVMPDLLQQVFINLALNAFDAMEELGGEIEPSLSIHSIYEMDRITIAFSDNGPGVPASIRDRILEPFFTTKEIGKGSGLGLAVTHGIVQEHGGTIRLDSGEGRIEFGKTPSDAGATFIVELPSRSAPPPSPE